MLHRIDDGDDQPTSVVQWLGDVKSSMLPNIFSGAW
jgi:hypothetical protein